MNNEKENEIKKALESIVNDPDFQAKRKEDFDNMVLHGEHQPEGQSKTIAVKIKPNYAGDYRLEYDGKYITLFGRDRKYVQFKFNETEPDSYEESVLVPCVIEIRNANPKIIEVTDNEIVIDLDNEEIKAL